ncbi:MAG: GrpB family protein [Patescibacteria group bacterium]
MLTKEQEIWVNHLSNTDSINIVPYDPNCVRQFAKVVDEVHGLLGESQEVVHAGASSLGISGQNEIDIYIPVFTDQFTETLKKVEALYGTPQSVYQLKRVRFQTIRDEKKIDVFVINRLDADWLRSRQFEQRLREQPELLGAYRLLKESSAGLSTRAYYRRKIHFINDVLAKLTSTSLPPEFNDRSFVSRLWADILILTRKKKIKAVCCESYKEEGKMRACKGCPNVYREDSPSAWRRFLAKWGVRKI